MKLSTYKYISTLLFLWSVITLKAQEDKFSLGAGAGFYNSFNDGKTANLAMRAEFYPKIEGGKIYVLHVGFNKPIEEGRTVYLEAKDASTRPSDIRAPYIFKTTTYHITFSSLIQVIEPSEAEPGMYFVLGLGADYISHTYDFNKAAYQDYYLFFAENLLVDKYYLGAHFDVGAGFSYKINRFKIYAEPKLTSVYGPSTEGGRSDKSRIDLVFQIQAGLQYTLSFYEDKE